MTIFGGIKFLITLKMHVHALSRASAMHCAIHHTMQCAMQHAMQCAMQHAMHCAMLHAKNHFMHSTLCQHAFCHVSVMSHCVRMQKCGSHKLEGNISGGSLSHHAFVVSMLNEWQQLLNQ